MSSVEQLSQLLLQIQSGDNAVRGSAEAHLYKDWLEAGGERPAQLLVGLAQLATQGEPAEQRAGAAVILRRCATRVSFESQQLLRVFDEISPEARAQVRDLVLQGMLAPNQATFTRHKLGDAVAEMARRSAAGDAVSAWPGLLETVVGAARDSADATVRETAFRVLGAVPELIEEREDLMGAAVQLLMHGFEDPSEAVRTTATMAFSAFFAYLPKRTWGMFKPLLPALLNVMEPLRQAHSEYELTSVLESLVTLAEIAPRMFNPVFGTLVDFTLAVAGDREFDESPRMTALELMAAFAEEAPNMCKHEPKYASQLIPQLLKMLTEVGEDDEEGIEWNNTDDNDQVEEDDPIHREAKLAVDRISLSLGGDVVTPLLFEYLPLMLGSASWRERVAGLMALSNAAEGCREEMLPSLDQILRAVEPLLHDPHPRVQWSACNAMGQLSTDLAPEVQEGYGPLILPGLIEKLSTQSVFKVQAHAAAALVNFSDAADQAVMDPFLDSLMTRLLALVQSPKRYVQEQALTTIAMVADSSQQLFAKYYDTLMPLVLNILKADVPTEYRLLKAKAIECSTLIALAVGREIFLPHMQQLGEILVHIQKEYPDGFMQTPTGEEEDPCQSYLVQSWGRLCRVVGQDFLPFLPVVMPPLLESAKSTADCHILDVEQAENLRDAEGWEVIKYGNQWLGVHTAVFEEKAGAIELLQVYPRELGGAFWPYVPEILKEVVMPGIKFYFNQRVRAYSCQLIPHLIVCAQQHFGNVPDTPDVLAIWRPLLEAVLESNLCNERETPGMFAEAFMAIYRCIELIGPAALGPQEQDLLSQCLLDATSAAKLRIEARASAAEPRGGSSSSSSNNNNINNINNSININNNDNNNSSNGAAGSAGPPGGGNITNDDDEYEEEDLEEDEDEREDEEVIDASNKLFHAMLKTYGAPLLGVGSIAQLVQLAPQFCASPVSDAQLWALEVIGDVAEYGKEQAAGALQQLGLAQYAVAALSAATVGQLVSSISAAPSNTWSPSELARASQEPVSPLVRASAALCVGRIALHGGPTFAALTMQALQPLFALATQPEARSEENIETTERCCGAIARILRTHATTNLSADQFSMAVGEWIKTLPITQQADGASFSYLFLAELIEKKHAVVLNGFDAAFAAVVKALVARTLSGKPADFVINQVKTLVASLPQDKQMQLFNQLNDAEKQVVQAVFA